jgi:ribosomal subunit interface protein
LKLLRQQEHFHDLVSHETAPNLWRSIDGAVQKLEQQLRKHKEKVRDHKNVETVRRS